MPRPPKKKTRVLAEAHRKGELKAETDHYAKLFKNKKQTKIWVTKQLEKLIDRIDPMELIATVGLATLFKTGIDWIQVSASGLLENNLIRTVAEQLKFPILGFLPFIADGQKEDTNFAQEATEWMICFVIAYIIVKHPEAVIALGGNLLGVAKGLIGGL